MPPLCEELQPILDAELAAGNSVADRGAAWGEPDGVMVLLRRPFRAEVRVPPPGVTLADVNDPHYWKSEYRCAAHRHVLACGF